MVSLSRTAFVDRAYGSDPIIARLVQPDRRKARVEGLAFAV
jgi:hypothetical protein